MSDCALQRVCTERQCNPKGITLGRQGVTKVDKHGRCICLALDVKLFLAVITVILLSPKLRLFTDCVVFFLIRDYHTQKI